MGKRELLPLLYRLVTALSYLTSLQSCLHLLELADLYKFILPSLLLSGDHFSLMPQQLLLLLHRPYLRLHPLIILLFDHTDFFSFLSCTVNFLEHLRLNQLEFAHAIPQQDSIVIQIFVLLNLIVTIGLHTLG